MTRRQMLKSAARFGTAAAGFGAAYALMRPGWRLRYPATMPPYAQPPRGIVRPPGAVGEPEFLAGCIRCFRCQDACEPGAIQFYSEADGPLWHTPYVEPALRACTLCMKCTQQCPTGVLQPMRVSDRSRVRMASVELREELCLSYKAKRIRAEQALLVRLGERATSSAAEAERRGPCGECYTVCPMREKAIRLEPGAFLSPVIEPGRCVGCGLCEEICRAVVRGDPAIRLVPERSRA